MSQISCDAVKCIYNCNGGCCLEQIRVNGADAVNYNQTECASFNEKRTGLSNSCCKTDEIPCPDSDIACSAENCRYNTGYRCTASSINVGTCYASESEETRCETFTD